MSGEEKFDLEGAARAIELAVLNSLREENAALKRENEAARRALWNMLCEDGMEGIGWHCRVCGVSMDLDMKEAHEHPCPGAALSRHSSSKANP